MKKTRQIRKLNSLKSVAKPCNAFCNGTMYFFEPVKSLRKNMVGWILEAPTGPRDGRIWYDRMKEKRDGRLKALKEIQSHLATAASAMQDDDRVILDKAIASIDKMLSDVPAESPRAKSPTRSVGHFLITDESGQPIQPIHSDYYTKKYGKDIGELALQWATFLDRPSVFDKITEGLPNKQVHDTDSQYGKLHQRMQEYPPGEFQLTSSFRTPQEHQDLIKRHQDNLRNNPPKLHKDIKLIDHAKPSDMIVPINVTYKEDDKK
jgi:hypothetical protein